jgi:predicted nucleic acid-binding Zn ribbon protein
VPQKICPVCEKKVEGRAQQAVYCSVYCRREAQKERRRADKPARDQIARLLFGPAEQPECLWCLVPLRGRRSDARYCSDKCKQAAHRYMKHSVFLDINPPSYYGMTDMRSLEYRQCVGRSKRPKRTNPRAVPPAS